ncbi:GGDEF domain-containing protein [Marinomonas sp.]|uniref:GGDEF domain-containing protein n=1 Tax=Marinomonas sp. TaxID=1904862 RepID=UPI003BACA14D
MSFFFRKLIRYYRYSIDKNLNIEEAYQQSFLAGFFSFIGSLITFFTAINSLFIQLYSLAISLFLVSGLLLLTFYILKSSLYSHYHNFSRCMAIIALYILGFYLIYAGGIKNSGPLWIYIIPSVTFAFLGLKQGIIANATFSVIASLMLFYPNDLFLATTYSYEFKTRLIYVFLTIVALSGFYEAARHYSFMRLKFMKEKYEHQAQFDYLTLLPNRRGIQKILNKEYQQIKLTHHVSTIATLDIDRFKVINDEFGHEVGDMVLKHTSKVLSDCIRSQDSLARWGGEEFLLLLPDTREADAIELLESIRERVEKTPFEHNTISISITLSVGLCETSPEVDFNDAIRFSDISLYQAKQAGRNTVFAYTPEL